MVRRFKSYIKTVQLSGCDGKLDVVLAIDASGSIRHERFSEVLEYLESVSREFEIAPDRTRVGVLRYSDTAEVVFNLNSYAKKQVICVNQLFQIF